MPICLYIYIYIYSCSLYSVYMIIILGTEVLNPRHNNLESFSHPNENLIRRLCAEDIFTFLQMNELHVVEINAQWLRYMCAYCDVQTQWQSRQLRYACALVEANKMADSCASNFDGNSALWRVCFRKKTRFNLIICSIEVICRSSWLIRYCTENWSTQTYVLNYCNPAVQPKQYLKCGAVKAVTID